ncbi:hypothetical protein [Neobacillus sp. 114]|uniref:hypothetical protein n=1 Tax=Neobacillus sp. 114 TaxID=3048535 RepID=UPI0024C41CB2|nr:hypothetical protein [Neobacillus sp. 114]
MEPSKREERRKIFRQELFTLKEEGYLSEAIVETVAKAHHQYHLDLLKHERIPIQTKNTEPVKKIAPKPQKTKKVLTAEEIRERNITWSLNIGVIFLLIGGLFVATSNWESMTSVMKSGSIAVVALMFFGIAMLAKKVLKIEKTAFAFIVLGSLFLPIFILSLGWFGLLGGYLSINGEGRYLLGMLGNIVPVIVYLHFAKNLESRLFVWFSYVSVSAGAAFLLAGLKLNVDFFYFGMMLFNVVLIFIYHQLKGKETYKLFTIEFVPYIQVNLVLCTLFMLFLYDNEVLYSFNLLLTAVVYLSMMYVSGRKEYHFIFSVMIVYGAYQLIENSFLDYFGEIVYALIGFAFVFIPKALDNKFSLDRVFQYTSAIISGLAFIYISLEGILLRSGSPSLVLMLAYFIIAANFIYLAYSSGKKLFPYLSSAFMASGLYEAIPLVLWKIEGIDISLSIFCSGFLLFTLIGVVRVKWLSIIHTSSKDVGLAVMAAAIMSAILFNQWWELGVMLLLTVMVTYLILKKEAGVIFKEMAHWTLPVSLGFSVVSFGQELNIRNEYYSVEFGNAVNFAAGAILVVLSAVLWKKWSEKKLSKTSLYSSASLYAIAIAHALFGPVNQLWVQPIIIAIGVALYFYLYKKIGTEWAPFLVSINTMLVYFSVIHSVSLKVEFGQLTSSLMATTSAVFLLGIAYLTRKIDSVLSAAFVWTGHILYPIALAATLVLYHTEALYSFAISLIVYGLSANLAKIEWNIKIFLYGAFTSLFLLISTGMDKWLDSVVGLYEFPITAAFILLFSMLVKDEYKKRTAYYLIPFAFFGIGCLLWTYPFNWQPYIVIVAYTLVTLLYLHKTKWDVLGIIPLFFLFAATAQFSYLGDLTPVQNLLLSGGLGILMSAIGHKVYEQLIIKGTNLITIRIDGYTIISFLYFWLMYFFMDESLWSHALPGILIAGNFFLQRKRVPANFSVLIGIIGLAYLLQPYYAIIGLLDIPLLWEREVQVLPIIVLVIFIRRLLKGRYSQITKSIEWAVLIIVSLLLIQDGLASNTIYDAIILGSLSLLSMLAGMYLQIKAYFFTGAGVLLLNVFLQTRPYWGNMPWWAYLLIAGLILIMVASFNEWHKQKLLKGETTFITVIKEKTIDRIKRWD